MTETKQNISKIREVIDSAKNIAIMPSKIPGLDAFAAAVGLFYILKAEDKPVSLVYAGKKPEEAGDIIKNDEVMSDVFQKDLVVSIDYSGTTATKVHYHTENDVLFLKIGPVTKNFDLKKIKADIRGFDYDLIITIGAQGLDDFGQTYNELEQEFSRAQIINIDNTEKNIKFGAFNVVDPAFSSLSLLVLDKTVEWGFKSNSKSAKAILSALSTNGVGRKIA